MVRGLVVVAVLLVIGAVAWSLVSSQGGETVPNAARPAITPDPQAPSVELNAATRVRHPEPARPVGPEPTVEPEADLPTTTPGLTVQVFDAVTREPLAPFRFVLDSAKGREAETVEANHHDLALAEGETATLTIEAEGYEPSAPRRVTGRQGDVAETFYLQPALRFTGVELWVQTPDGNPVRRLEVEALRIEPTAQQRAELWHRKAADERGIYQLPDLPAGRFRLRLRALDEDGSPTTHRIHEEDVAFTGTERIVRNVQLRAGALILLTVRDPDGAMLGPEIAVRLVPPDDSELTTAWHADGDREILVRKGGLPSAATCRLAEPVPPGNYRIEARRGTGPVSSLEVSLFAGDRREVTLTVQ